MTNPIPSSDLDALVERLAGVDERYCEQLPSHTEELCEDALTAITSLRNQLTASEARERELLEFVKTLALRDDSIGDDARNALTNTENRQ